jgi:hypothetical protein
MRHIYAERRQLYSIIHFSAFAHFSALISQTKMCSFLLLSVRFAMHIVSMPLDFVVRVEARQIVAMVEIDR